MSWREAPITQRMGHRVARVRAWWRRARALPLAVRAAIVLTGAGALMLAAPPMLVSGGVLAVALLLALQAAAWPDGRTPGAVVATSMIMVGAQSLFGETVPLAQVVALAVLLYLHHSAAALGAAVRTDAVMPLAVGWHWLRRAGLVLLVSVVVMAGMSGLAERAPTRPVTLLVAVAALAAVGVVGILAHLRFRRVAGA